MKLLLDEHFSPEIARQLRERGHDVIAVKERHDLESHPDRVHFASMAGQRRAIATQDLGDFRPLLAETMRAGGTTYGLVCVPSSFPLSRGAIGSAVRGLENLLRLARTTIRSPARKARYGCIAWFVLAAWFGRGRHGRMRYAPRRGSGFAWFVLAAWFGRGAARAYAIRPYGGSGFWVVGVGGMVRSGAARAYAIRPYGGVRDL